MPFVFHLYHGFINIFLTYRLLFLAGRFIKNRDISSQFQLYEGEFPDKLYSARYQFQNMFEVPILFYLLCILYEFNIFTMVDIYLAWGFVFFRFMHFLVRLESKNLNIKPEH